MSDGGQDAKTVFVRRRWYLRYVTLALVVVILAYAGIDQGTDRTFFGIPAMAVVALSAVVLAIGAYVMLRYWRCPACNKRLPSNATIFGSVQCRHCGLKLA